MWILFFRQAATSGTQDVNPDLWIQVNAQLENIKQMLADYKTDADSMTAQEKLNKMHNFTRKGKDKWPQKRRTQAF